ncbi:MAG TPA: hypothetical protein VG818_02510, partial [Gemmatimonadaceae bacterium]|nr:hypothetical protein [Gemmatimonadaceae bacterium]
MALVLGCGEGGHATAPTTPAADSPAPVGAIVAVSPAQLRDTVAHTVPVVVRVVSATGAGLPNYVVHFTTAGTGGTVSPTTVVSDAAGSAAAAWTLGQAAGGDTLIASVGPRTTQVVVATAVAAAPARFALVSGDAQSDTVGAPLATPIAVRVTDAFGNAAPGASVQFAVASGHGALSAAVSLTDSTGVAST